MKKKTSKKAKVSSKASDRRKAATKVIKVDYLARVEGEGALYLKYKKGQVEEVRLKIFEPPRFFEAFMQGRDFREAPDITARICGICPVAYQMSAVHAMEQALGVVVPEPLRQLRRLLYCGEWIESHVLHIYMLHAPDFLGLPDVMSMAKTNKTEVERGLRQKKRGNQI
ncbi:MAG: nickel-dependent hydrogenase large subunit, partial [Bdellovibrionales bacterium]|nr:nickel-dependent hydrogenase large subunit [Bdellovibrionales bacterium]